MRRLLILLFVLPLTSLAQRGQVNPTIAIKDTVDGKLKEVVNPHYTDTTYLVIDKLTDTFKQASNSAWEKYLPSLIALITVLASSSVALYVGKRNANVQEINAKNQLETQQAIAQDQMKVTREQIERSSKNTLEQARATILSQSRITYLNELRKLLAEFIKISASISVQLHDIQKIGDVEKKNDLTKPLMDSYVEQKALQSQIEMYLNLQEENHRNLKEGIEELIKVITSKNHVHLGEKMDNVITKAHTLLKGTWEEAKSEVMNLKNQ